MEKINILNDRTFFFITLESSTPKVTTIEIFISMHIFKIMVLE